MILKLVKTILINISCYLLETQKKMKITEKVYDYLIIPRTINIEVEKVQIPINDLYKYSYGSSMHTKQSIERRLTEFLTKQFPDKNILEVDIENKGAGNYYLIVTFPA